MRTCQAEFDAGRALAQEAVELLRGLGGNTQSLRDALSVVAMTLYNQGDFAQARPYVEENIELEREANDRWGIARSLSNLAEMGFAEGDLETAERYWGECLPIEVALGDSRYVAITLHNLGETLRARGDLPAARDRFTESLERFRDVDFLLGIANSLASLAEVLIEQGDADATRVLGEAVTNARRLGDSGLTPTLLEIVGKHAVRAGDLLQAARLFGAAETLRAATGAQLSPLEQQKVEAELVAVRDAPDPAVALARAQGRATSGEQALDEASAMLERLGGEPGIDITALTPREREIVELFRSELTNREIAARLGVAKATADKHVANILRKLGVASRDDVRRLAPPRDA